MNSITKIVVALLVIALIAVVGLIVITKDQGAAGTTAAATAEPTAQATTTATAEPETTETDNIEETPQPADADADSAKADAAANEAQNDDAQGTMYEGALAGLTEEEIAALAMAEEEAMHENGADDAGAEGAVD